MKRNERMKLLRTSNGYTQKQFAELLGVAVNTVQKWEQGVRSPDRRSKIALRKIFKVIEE
jgi:DNA-binding transcriptional regulator YiaG